MHAFFVTAATLLGALFLTATSVPAQIIFNLNNVSLETQTGNLAAGTLSGTFTSNTALTALLSWNIMATATGLLNGHAFAGFDYNNNGITSNSAAYYNVGNGGLMTGFELDSPLNSTTMNNSYSLRLLFPTNLSGNGTTTLSALPSALPSYESEHYSGGNRDVSSGSVSVVPEPASWALALICVSLFACLRACRNAIQRHPYPYTLRLNSIFFHARA